MSDTVLPLSLSQHEVWLDQRAWPESPHLTIGGAMHLRGAFRPDLLQAALDRMVDEFDVFRLIPHAAGGQTLLGTYRQALIWHTLDDKQPNMREASQAWWASSLQEPFAMDATPPWRIAVLRASDTEHCVIIQFHHLVMDGWGTTQVFRRWSELYAALAAGDAAAPPRDGDYLRYIEECHAYRASPEFERDREFWAAQLPQLPPPLFDRHGPAQQASPHTTQATLPRASVADIPLARQDYTRIQASTSAPGLSAFCLFLAALALYFCRAREVSEIVIGVPSLNRNGKRHKATPGMFVGVIPLRIEIDLHEPLAELLAKVGRSLRNALRHARFPLSEVARQVQAIRSHRDSIFDVMLSYERQDYSVTFGEAKPIDSWQLFPGLARYPLGITVCEFDSEGDLALVLEGSEAVFAPGEVQLIAERLRHVMCAIAATPQARVDEIDILPSRERSALIDGIHGALRTTPSPEPFIRQFEAQAKAQPDATALLWDGGRLDYAALDRQALATAHTLRLAGVARGSIVALCMRRSADAVIAMLGIAKAGAAFLPLDVDAPDARLAVVLTESGAAAVIADASEHDRLSALHPAVIRPEAMRANPPRAADWPAAVASDPAYVLFTSGSTGRPKGVLVEHGALSRRLGWIARAYAITPQDCAAQATQMTFDPALIELLLPLTQGARVALPPPGRLAAETIAGFAARHEVTIMAFVPTTLQRFIDAAAETKGLKLRVACCGGDVLPPATAQRFLRETGARLFNVYGPTEACIFATAWPCTADDGADSLPVGMPIDDTRLYVLDAQRRPVPFGCAGDIYIGGGTLARGYLNRPDLDRDAFLPDPFVAGGRMYRSGDRGWIGQDGALHFLGRSDRQIKLRGYRVEPAEIEATLLSAAGVNQAAVRMLDHDGPARLHAWVAASTQDSASLHRHLRSRLPDYMLPGGITIMPALPLNSTGKVDYSALPIPPATAPDAAPRAPRTQLERDLQSIWEAALKREGIGIDHDFFELGGDSLAAVDILSGVQRATGKQLSLLTLTENPSVAQLASALEEAAGPARLLLPLGLQLGDRTLFLAASGHGDLLRFQALARALGPRVNLLMLQPPSDGQFKDLSELANLYADKIAPRAHTPVTLAGFSVGGIAALETARTLQARGVAVRELILIDTVFPGPLLRRPRFWRLLAWLTRNLYVQELSMNGRRLGAMFSDSGLVSQVMALHEYRPQAFAGRTCLIKSSGLANWDRWLFRPWQRLPHGELRIRGITGLHGSVFEALHVSELAAVLRGELGDAD